MKSGRKDLLRTMGMKILEVGFHTSRRVVLDISID